MLIDLSVKDLVHYKEKIIPYDNLVNITVDDFKYYKLDDIININNFAGNDTIPLANFNLPTQNAIGLRFMEFEGYIKTFDTGTELKNFFYKDKIGYLFKEVKEVFPILKRACEASNIPEVLYTKYNNIIEIELDKILVPDDNLIPLLHEVSISYRDTTINKDIFIYYNLTRSKKISVELPSDIKNIILTVAPVQVEIKFRDEYKDDLISKQYLKYDSVTNQYYYETFTNQTRKYVPPEFLDYRAISKKHYHYNITISKSSKLGITPISTSFRFNNTTFDLINSNPIIKLFEEESDTYSTSDDYRTQYKQKWFEEPSLIMAKYVENMQYHIGVVSGLDHCKEMEYGKVPDNFQPIINFIDIDKVPMEDLNYLLLVYFFKINKNNKEKKTFIYKTIALLDVNFNRGQYDKIYNFKEFFITQFTNYLKLSTDQIPFGFGFHSAIKSFINTRSFNKEHIVDEVKQYLYQFNSYYLSNFDLVDIVEQELDNGIFVKLSIVITIRIKQEIITLQIVSN